MSLSCALGNIARALSDLAKSSGNLKAECAVRPPASRAAAMPKEATAPVMSFSYLTKANSKLSRKVLPVPPGASKKTMPPLSLPIIPVIAIKACC
ncbi:hypothetical protein TNCT_317091 [Trichonephila clavata]|uniref:Uncharacterized protein n=1 Tax=Trichonephila clavata TaxID=2740835 RepID=A0A8X6LD84_TRICU|nr:hypothetical protein TNCT_317091 [Trichonephila clavata]